jgi:hypothetical protein
MIIRLEVLILLTANGSQGAVFLACFPYRQTGWNFYSLDGFSEIIAIHPAGAGWHDYSLVLALRRLFISQLAMSREAC